jgi:hypothetical protein
MYIQSAIAHPNIALVKMHNRTQYLATGRLIIGRYGEKILTNN